MVYESTFDRLVIAVFSFASPFENTFENVGEKIKIPKKFQTKLDIIKKMRIRPNNMNSTNMIICILKFLDIVAVVLTKSEFQCNENMVICVFPFSGIAHIAFPKESRQR